MKAKKLLSVLLAVLMMALTLTIAAVPTSAVGVGDTIQFGNYPQSEVSETTALKNAANAATWKSYGYYIGTGFYDGNMAASNYMKYADFFLNCVKYRAVKFTRYRPYGTRLPSNWDKTHQDDNGYVTDTTYYFKYEPLTWRVLDPSTGLVLCDSIIDSQAYQNIVRESNSDYYVGTTSTYANNYASSTIRTWLNNDFYNTAFNSSQMANIKNTTVNNDAYLSTYSQYNAVSTTNKIYLLSYREVENSSYGLGFSDDRRAKGTDYAKCQGLYVNSSGFQDWRLRTPGPNSNFACYVGDDGIQVSWSNYSNSDGTNNGIRPACNLTSLTSNTTMDGLCTISASADPSAGGTVTGAGTYGKGETVTLTATPKYGYNFTGWYRGTTRVTTNTSYSFTVSADAAYTAKFSPKNYTVTANAGTGGTVSGGGTFAYNTSTTVKATPSTNFHFTGWYNGNTRVSTSANYTFTVTESVTLTASFEWNTYIVTANAGEGGTASGSGAYGHGSSVTLTATPNSGYHFVGWYKGSTKVSTSQNYSFTVTENVTLTAKFERTTYTVTVNPDPANGGTVTGGGTFPEGSSTKLTATANPGYHFVGFIDETGERWGNVSPTISVTKDMTFTAQFVNVAAMPTIKNSTDTLNDGDWYFDKDALIAAFAAAFNMTTEEASGMLAEVAIAKYDPQSGIIVFMDASGDIDGATVALPDGGEVYALYKTGIKQYRDPAVQTYTVTANASAGGTVTAGGTFDEGATATLTATPNSGYHFLGWYKGDSKVSADATYSFTVTENVTLTAKFEKDASSGDNGGNNSQPQHGSCKWCGKDHNGNFFQKIIGFFHSIFAAIFGARY